MSEELKSPPGWNRFPGPPNRQVRTLYWDEGSWWINLAQWTDRYGMTKDSRSKQPNRDLFYQEIEIDLPTGTPEDYGVQL